MEAGKGDKKVEKKIQFLRRRLKPLFPGNPTFVLEAFYYSALRRTTRPNMRLHV